MGRNTADSLSGGGALLRQDRGHVCQIHRRQRLQRGHEGVQCVVLEARGVLHQPLLRKEKGEGHIGTRETTTKITETAGTSQGRSNLAWRTVPKVARCGQAPFSQSATAQTPVTLYQY